MLSLIAAISKNHVIGRGNKLPWHLPKDLARFKKITWGHKIIMGRRTFASVRKPLPGRENIVLTKQPISINGCTVVHSVEESLALIRGDEEAFVIGGESIFRQFLPYAERIFLTEISIEMEGDAFFPELDKLTWEEVDRVRGNQDSDSTPCYDFVTYQRRKHKGKKNY